MAEVVAWLVRWVGFVALAGLVGGLAVDLLVLSAHAPELGAVRGRLRALRLVSALVLLAASGGELLLRAATMSCCWPCSRRRAPDRARGGASAPCSRWASRPPSR